MRSRRISRCSATGWGKGLQRRAGRFALIAVLLGAARAHSDPERAIAATPAPSVTAATAVGTLYYNAGTRYASGPRADYPAPHVHVTADGSAVTTASDGTLSWFSLAPATVVTTCNGDAAVVRNMAGAPATTTLSLAPSGAATWNAATTEIDDAQVSTYVYANLAIARARAIAPTLPFLAGPITFYVNENIGCDAGSTGSEVHLGRGTTTCENPGRVADIVFHEFAHGFHFHEIIAGVGAFDAALSEGLADFFTADLTGDSGIGRGVHYTDTALRDIDPPDVERRYPADVSDDSHITGEIISGALWDLRGALMIAVGRDAGIAATDRVFVGIMQRAADIPSSYHSALLADDDDGDLGNGTPHFCALERAFGIHGLVAEYEDATVAMPIVDRRMIRVEVMTPTGTACPPRHVASMRIRWNIDDAAANEFALDHSGDVWIGTFPEQAMRVVVSYTVTVAFDDGSTLTLPSNPADPPYQAVIEADAGGCSSTHEGTSVAIAALWRRRRTRR